MPKSAGIEAAFRAFVREIVVAELKGLPQKSEPAAKLPRRIRSKVEMTRWVADRRARRVPSFVIKMTKLDTKKKIVAKYGENAAFEKGKPAPKLAKAA